MLGVGTLLIAWGSASLVFRTWRDGYRDRLAFGRGEVSAAVDPLIKSVPPGMDRLEWAIMVAQSHRMLDDLVGANLLDRNGLISLRDDLRRRVGSARPETAESTLIRIWSEMELKAGPSLARRERPARIDLAVTIDPLRNASPPGVEPSAWNRAVSETESMLIALSSRPLDADRRSALRARWSPLISRLRPESAREILARIYSDVDAPPKEIPAIVRGPG